MTQELFEFYAILVVVMVLAVVAAVVRHGPRAAAMYEETARDMDPERAKKLRRSAARLRRWRLPGVSLPEDPEDRS